MTALRVHEIAHGMAISRGIPTRLLSAVEERAKKAERAVLTVDGFRPLGAGATTLARRIVDRAVADHAAGVLERRCEP